MYILGAGESGKSTVLKQMKLLYAQGFSKSEKEEWRAIIFQNLQGAFKVILDAMDELTIPFQNEKNKVSSKGIEKTIFEAHNTTGTLRPGDRRI